MSLQHYSIFLQLTGSAGLQSGSWQTLVSGPTSRYPANTSLSSYIRDIWQRYLIQYEMSKDSIPIRLHRENHFRDLSHHFWRLIISAAIITSLPPFPIKSEAISPYWILVDPTPPASHEKKTLVLLLLTPSSSGMERTISPLRSSSSGSHFGTER